MALQIRFTMGVHALQAITLCLAAVEDVPIFDVTLERASLRRDGLPHHKLNVSLHQTSGTRADASLSGIMRERGQYRTSRNTLHLENIDVVEMQRGRGYSSMMNAIQVLYTNHYLHSRHNKRYNEEIYYYSTEGVENTLIHYKHGFRFAVGEEWNDFWYDLEDDMGRLTGEEALTQAFEDCIASGKRTTIEKYLNDRNDQGKASEIPRDDQKECDDDKDLPLRLGMKMDDPVHVWAVEKGWRLELDRETEDLKTKDIENVKIIYRTTRQTFHLHKGEEVKAIVHCKLRHKVEWTYNRAGTGTGTGTK